jgi:serine/threonine protein kinase
VKEGVRKETGQKFAIKIIDKKDAVFDAESLEEEVNAVHEMKSFAVQRFKYSSGVQIVVMKKVNHPNCVALYGIFDESSKFYLVLDL